MLKVNIAASFVSQRVKLFLFFYLKVVALLTGCANATVPSICQLHLMPHNTSDTEKNILEEDVEQLIWLVEY